MKLINRIGKFFVDEKETDIQQQDTAEDEAVTGLENDNKILGEYPVIENSKIVFSGKNNILFCEQGVVLKDSTITFNGDNAVVYLSKNNHSYFLDLSANSSNVFYMGRDNYINRIMHIILSERKHVFIGSKGIFSFEIWMRNADPHLIYSYESGHRLNNSQSIFLGDHVWVGQSAMILKGTEIDSGSIIGAMSVVAGKKIGHNSSWGGNPARKISDSVFWDGACVHNWKQEKTQKSQVYASFYNTDPERYIYEYDRDQAIPFRDLDAAFDRNSPEENVEFLKALSDNNCKNRFVHEVS